jgi:D-arginine dehydrogenase
VVVNAAGAWGDLVGIMAGVAPLGLEARRRTVALVDPPAGIDPQPWPAIVDIDEQFYFKPEAGKILMSPADEALVEPCDAYADDIDVAIAVDRIQQVADIPVTRISHSWAGLRTFAADRSPVVGFDGIAPGFFWLVGQGGYGIQTSPALSRLAAALVRDEAIPPDLAKLGLDPAKLDPQRFSRGV